MYEHSKKLHCFENKLYLSSPTMHGDELTYIKTAYDTNWMSTMGANINEIEKQICKYVGCKYAVALGTGTSAIHMAVKLAGVKQGEKVFCSDLTFAATVNPIKYEGGEPVFIDSEYETWNMDPVALEQAFELYPDVRVVVVAHLYGTPAKMDEIKAVCQRHNAVIVEDAAESLGATYKTYMNDEVEDKDGCRGTAGQEEKQVADGSKESDCSAVILGQQTGTFGKYNAISFNGNKIITGSSGGMFLTDDREAADRVRKWSTQSRENAPWYQHEEIGYNYRMSNVVAGIVRGQLPHLDEHIARKKEIYERYRKGFADLPVTMNPYDEKRSEPNFWLSCLLIDNEAMCRQIRDEHEVLYTSETKESCPTEILETLAKYNAEGRPIWKPMHMQPIYRMNGFVTREGDGRAVISTEKGSLVMGKDGKPLDVGRDIFNRGLCLPSDIKMSEEQQDIVIEMVRSCFG